MPAFTSLTSLRSALSDALISLPKAESFVIKDFSDSLTENDPSGFGYNLQMVEYSVTYQNGTSRDWKFWFRVNPGDGSVNYWSGEHKGVTGGVPNPLKQPTTTRDPHFTESQIKQAIESNFTGWEVLPNGIQVQVQGEKDVVSIEAKNTAPADSKDHRVIHRSIKAWKDDQGNPQWALMEQV